MATLAEPKQPKVSADEAREVAEAAREQEWAAPSFVRDLFLGKLRMDLIHPYPEQDPDEVARAKAVPRKARAIPARSSGFRSHRSRGRNPRDGDRRTAPAR